MAATLSIEVRGEVITWPEDFAIVMISYYRKHGIPFRIRTLNGTPSATDRP